jgi:hypothetical protein
MRSAVRQRKPPGSACAASTATADVYADGDERRRWTGPSNPDLHPWLGYAGIVP